MEKWTGELQAPPFWLNPALEVTSANDAPKLSTAEFLIQSVDALRAAGCTFDQAINVTANAVNETGWGRYYRGWNLGGWKITKGTANNPDGTARRWFRALGNKSSGDPQTCFYRAFGSLRDFYEAWLLQFVPKNGSGRYKKTGEAFWAGEEWFDDLIAAGYKGDVTRRNPRPSIAAHEKIIGSVVIYYCQRKLGLVADGKWGPRSRAACMLYQANHGLEQTGQLDDETIRLLVAPTSPQERLSKYAKVCAKCDGSEADSEIQYETTLEQEEARAKEKGASVQAPAPALVKAKEPEPEVAAPEVQIEPTVEEPKPSPVEEPKPATGKPSKK